MADTKLQQIGPDTAQLSTQLSFTEKMQIDALRNIGGSVSHGSGQINGSVNKALANVNNTSKSAMILGADLANKMEQAGSFRKNSSDYITKAVTKTTRDKLALYQENTITQEVNDIKNRAPSAKKLSVKEKINKSKQALLGIGFDNNPDASYGGNMFPSDLNEFAEAYVTLEWAQYTRSGPFTKGKMTGATPVHLPLPDNFTFEHNIKLQPADTGFYQDLLTTQSGRSAVASLRNGQLGDAINDVVKGIKDATKSEAADFASMSLNRAGFAALNSADEVLGGLASQIKGGIPNPHPTVFFKGLELRQFQWNWKLVPKTKKDAKNIRNILDFLRVVIIPQQEDNFLNYPYIVKPKINGEKSAIYGNFKRAMVSSLSINYSGEGSSAFFIDGMPVSVLLAMQFTEIENYTGV